MWTFPSESLAVTITVVHFSATWTFVSLVADIMPQEESFSVSNDTGSPFLEATNGESNTTVYCGRPGESKIQPLASNLKSCRNLKCLGA